MSKHDLTGPYSPLKIFHHPARLTALRHGLQPAPAQVQLILSDLCNEDCGFCAYRVSGSPSNQLFNDPETGSHNPSRMIPYPKVIEILNDCKDMGVGGIQLTGGGEPSIHPRFDDTLREIVNRELRLSLVTNGVKIREGAVETLMQAEWVRVSIDAGTATTYAAMRCVPTSFFEKACATVQRLAEAKKRTGSHVELGVGFVVTKENWGEVTLAATRAKELGADNIRISAAFMPDNEDYHAAYYREAAFDTAQAERVVGSETFKVINRFGDRLEDLRQHNPDYTFCGYQHFTTYIGGDLNVYRCCNLAYNERGKIGSLAAQSFRDLWESQWKRADFKHFDATGCQRCQFNGINRVINYALEPEPQSVDFV